MSCTLSKIFLETWPAASPRGVGAHRDTGVLTLLLAEPGRRGLQVRRGKGTHSDDGWIDAPPLEGAFIVNIGERLEVASGLSAGEVIAVKGAGFLKDGDMVAVADALAAPDEPAAASAAPAASTSG